MRHTSIAHIQPMHDIHDPERSVGMPSQRGAYSRHSVHILRCASCDISDHHLEPGSCTGGTVTLRRSKVCILQHCPCAVGVGPALKLSCSRDVVKQRHRQTSASLQLERDPQHVSMHASSCRDTWNRTRRHNHRLPSGDSPHFQLHSPVPPVPRRNVLSQTS